MPHQISYYYNDQAKHAIAEIIAVNLTVFDSQIPKIDFSHNFLQFELSIFSKFSKKAQPKKTVSFTC